MSKELDSGRPLAPVALQSALRAARHTQVARDRAFH